MNDSDAADDGLRTTRIYDIYEQICRQEAADTLSLRRVRDLLKEHAFLEVIEQTRYSGGSSERAYTKHKLFENPEVILNVLEGDVEPTGLP